MSILCPECGAPMKLRSTGKFTYRNGTRRRFWGCTRYPDCKGMHGAHPDGRPVGIPANAETKRARIRAHAAFDEVWKSGAMDRRAAYRFMQDLMGMTADEAHIGRFTKEQCDTLVERIAEVRRSGEKYKPLGAMA
jgi:ssDNA-binding Zn-finger/Zn-ribbon topoisomerase 1